LIMKSYKCINNQNFSFKHLSITPIRYEDRLKIMQWRNEQIYHLRQSKKLTELDQNNYFENTLEKNFDEIEPKQILFSFMEKTKCIGYGGFVNINWVDKRAEMSFLLDTSLKGEFDTYSYYFTNFIYLLKKVAFNEIGFNRIFTETYSFRKKHISILEKNGFKLEGVMKEHIFMHKEKNYYDSLIHGSLKKNYEK